ncbi:alpha-hydroxy acid oxidase [Caenimonas terrae]|uniref:Alpha-hydroxy acid oxidase n=1 Tax=Caenimonas terrae TaxID=696074 RepID=A0ABW0NBG3_9BURK
MRSCPPRPFSVAACYSIDDLRRLARHRLPRSIFDFYDGGAEDESTLQENRAAFGRHRLAPRALVDVAAASTAASLFGQPLGLPMAVGPTGALAFGWRDADLHLARAAASHGIPFTLSSSGTASIEAVAKASSGRLWFQAYVLRNRDFFWKMIERADHAGFEALVITVDLPVGGKRERDFHNQFSVPFRITRRNALDFARHPRWTLDLLRRGIPVFENLRGLELAALSATEIASSVGRSYDPAFDWDRLAEVRARWPRKLIVKGISRGDDARRLVGLGCDAIVVSNHGGRQLDGAVATLDALPEVVQAVAGRLPVLLDGGIRRGTDVAKALALGATAVLLGRATLFGVAAGGAAGAMKALDILRDEFLRTLQLCGAASPQGLTADLLRHRFTPKETST